MEDKKRILFVTDTFGYGGAEKQMAFVAEGLVKNGFTIAICNLKQTGNYGGKRVVSEDIEFFIADIKYKNTIQSNYDLIKFTLLSAKKFKPDVIIGFKQVGFFAVIVGRLLKVPSVISERADPYRAFSNASLLTRIKLWIMNRASGAVFQTEQAAAFYRDQLRKRSVVIPNPVFVNGEVPNIDYANLPKTVVSLGRLDNKQKRLDVLLDAFKFFLNTHPGYQLKIYGNGADEDLVKQWIKEKGLSSFVSLMGVSTNAIADISREGIFIITSDFEGISNTLLEAMAIGMPVVSTDHTPGGARLLIQDGENGLLAPIGDAKALGQALGRFADDALFAEHCGRNAKSVLERFSPNKILRMWMDYLNQLC